MQKRQNTGKKLADLIQMDDPESVLHEVEHIVGLMYPRNAFSRVQIAFYDVERLFQGRFPGFRECNTKFHDFRHTTDCFLAMARLIHGAFSDGLHFDHDSIILSLIAALIHDTGYIQEESDITGTGAKHTLTHVNRSIEFMEQYFNGVGLTDDEFQHARRCLKCTGLDVRIDEIQFKKGSHAVLGKMLGTADLLGQMADRTYLEKLVFLHKEFEEGGITHFADAVDLLKQTSTFYKTTQTRLAVELAGVNRFARPHFSARWQIDEDLYQQAMERNISYLEKIMNGHEHEYIKFLRRGGLLE